MHLQTLARALPMKQDLHEPERLVLSLSPYEHLHRLLRLCRVHAFRNIQKSSVPEDVRVLMRGLACIEHPDWDGTLCKIAEKGGKVASGTDDTLDVKLVKILT